MVNVYDYLTALNQIILRLKYINPNEEENKNLQISCHL